MKTQTYSERLREITALLADVVRDMYYEDNVRDSGILSRALEKIVNMRDRYEDVESKEAGQ